MTKKTPAIAANPGAPGKKKVLVVDDHPVFRAGLIGLLQHEPDLTVCGEAEDAARTIAAVERLLPDLVLLDMGLPDRSGLELLKDLQILRPGLPVLIISMHDETLYAERVLRAGGRGYIMKQAGPEKIIGAVRKILDGGTYVSERTSARILENISGRRPNAAGSAVARLTDRELEILRLIGEGKEGQDIASHLHLSIKTVDTHRAHIREKLGLKNTTELIHYAARWTDGQP
jgi:DNA-binding NarL/FixJ family response regulator